MTRLPTVRRVLMVLAIALAVTALWLVFDNPEIHGTSRAADYTCLAPYDTVLNEANNLPGGETPPDAEDIGRRCRQAGQDRFGLAVGVGFTAVAAGVAVLALRRRQPSVEH